MNYKHGCLTIRNGGLKTLKLYSNMISMILLRRSGFCRAWQFWLKRPTTTRQLNNFNHVKLSMATHDADNQITDRDLNLAKAIETLLKA